MADSGARVGDFPYDVALSFAGEQRAYVEKVAAALRRRGLRPFYDDYEKASLWGKDLYEHLDWVYQKAARFCVLFASEQYARKVWTTHERSSAQARALESSQEYVLPVRFDDTEIPGLRNTIAYVDARSMHPAKLAKLISEKLGPRIRKNYLPAHPDKLHKALDAQSPNEVEAVESIALAFMQTLNRMDEDERKLVVEIFLCGCPSEMPNNMHIALDVVRRDMGITPAAVIERLRAMSSIGFEHAVRTDEEHDGEIIVVRWSDRTTYEDDFISDYAAEHSTEIVDQMLEIGISDGYCRGCAEERIVRGDFSALSSGSDS